MGLPQLLAPNPTGIVLDLYSVSWIRECRVQGVSAHYQLQCCSEPQPDQQGARLLHLRGRGGAAGQEEDHHCGQVNTEYCALIGPHLAILSTDWPTHGNTET